MGNRDNPLSRKLWADKFYREMEDRKKMREFLPKVSPEKREGFVAEPELTIMGLIGILIRMMLKHGNIKVSSGDCEGYYDTLSPSDVKLYDKDRLVVGR